MLCRAEERGGHTGFWCAHGEERWGQKPAGHQSATPTAGALQAVERSRLAHSIVAPGRLAADAPQHPGDARMLSFLQ